MSLPGFLQFKPDIDYKLEKEIAVGGAAKIYETTIYSDELRERAGRCEKCIAKVVQVNGKLVSFRYLLTDRLTDPGVHFQRSTRTR